MAKVLNLDEVLQTEKRTLILGGTEYAVTEMSVSDYVEATKTAEKLQDNRDTELQMTETARLIARQLTPAIDQAYLMGLSVERLYAIAEFVRGVDPEEIIKRANKDAKPAEAQAGN